jgi:hypothetical protein
MEHRVKGPGRKAQGKRLVGVGGRRIQVQSSNLKLKIKGYTAYGLLLTVYHLRFERSNAKG